MTMVEIPMPTTVKELWNTAWVAENAEEAIAQAERMFDLFEGKRVAVDRLLFLDGMDYDEVLFREPWPEVWVNGLNTERGWDGEVLYAEWYVRAADRGQFVTSHTGRVYRMMDIDDDAGGDLTTTAPGIGTAEGFGHKDGPFIYPVVGHA